MDYKRLCTFGDARILIIGDLMLDIYQYGNCDRISPEAPVPVVNFIKEDKMLGGAGNVLKNLVSFGLNCEIISVVGKDLSGQNILNELTKINISTNSLIIDRDRCTTEKCRLVASGQQLIRIDKENRFPIKKNIEDKIIKYVSKNIKNYNVILFSDYLKGVLTERICNEIIKIAKNNNVLTLVDPKGANCEKYKHIDLIKPNLKEAEVLINKKIITDEDLKSACIEIKNLFECKYVVITLSEKGIALFDDSFKIIPTQSFQVIDVSGAGDTVLASLSICLLQKFTLFEACEFANKAASIVIKKFGSTTTTIEEVINLN